MTTLLSNSLELTDDPHFETDYLAREAGIGRRQLRALTGQSVCEFTPRDRKP